MDNQNFKVIIALKGSKDQKIQNLRCTIQIMDKVKYTQLPESEGQFFNLNNITTEPISIQFDSLKPPSRIGALSIPIPDEVLMKDEVEIADLFTLDCILDGRQERYTGRYYIIIINKTKKLQQFQINDVDKPQEKQKVELTSPTQVYIQSIEDRNLERQKEKYVNRLLEQEPKKQGVKSKIKKHEPTIADYNGEAIEIKRVDEVKEINTVPFRIYNDNPTKQSRSPLRDNAQIEFHKQQSLMMEEQVKCAREQLLQAQQLQESSKTSDSKRLELQVLIKGHIVEVEQRREEIEKYHQQVDLDKLQYESNLRHSNQVIGNAQMENERLRVELKGRDILISQLQESLKTMEECDRVCRSQQERLDKQDILVKDIQQAYGVQVKKLQHEINDLDTLQVQAIKDKSESERVVHDLITQMQKLKDQITSLHLVADQDKRKNMVEVARESLIRTLNDQITHLQLNLDESNTINEQVRGLLEKQSKDYEDSTKLQLRLTSQHLTQQQQLQDKIKDMNTKITDLEQLNVTGIKQLQQLISSNTQLNDQLTSKAIPQNELDIYKQESSQLLGINKQFLLTINNLTEQIQIQNNQFRYLKDKLHESSEASQEQEKYINQLKVLITDLSEREAVYIPAAGDKVDMKIADVIRGSADQDKLIRLFVREGEGVYQFGSKRIYIKLEQDKVLIRQGGGFLTIEEFLQINTQRELEHLKDPIAIYNKNKAVNKKMDMMVKVGQGQGG